MPSPTTAQPRTVTLDALRGVAAWLVLLSHVGFWTGETSGGAVGSLAARGDVGVAIFFALSAALLSAPFVRRGLGEPATFSPARYARRRLARILPAYYLALAGVLLTAVALGDPGGVLSLPTVLVHLVLGQGVTGVTFQSFTQTWSLTTEAVFYLVLPLGAALAVPWVLAAGPGAADESARRRARGRRMILGCAVLGLLGLPVQGLAAVFTGEGASWWAGALATSVPGHALWFAVGIAVTVLLEAERAGTRLWGGRAGELVEVLRTSPGTLVLLALVVWAVAATPLAGPRDLTDPAAGALVAREVLYGVIALALLLAATSRGLPERAAASRLAGPSRWLGDTSYGVFLWHVLVLQVVYAALDLRLFYVPFVPMLVLVTVLSLGIAHLSWVLVERRFIAWAHRDAAARPAAARR